MTYLMYIYNSVELRAFDRAGRHTDQEECFATFTAAYSIDSGVMEQFDVGKCTM